MLRVYAVQLLAKGHGVLHFEGAKVSFDSYNVYFIDLHIKKYHSWIKKKK